MATSVLTAKATIKAHDILANSELTTKEKVKAVLPMYIPSIVIGVSTLSCIIGANVLNKQHQKALTSAYILLDQSYKEYRNKVTELYGKEANEKVEEELSKDNNPGDEELRLFYDVHSDRFFESTLFKVQKAEYYINRELTMRDYVYLNEWYEELDLDIVENGYALGWSVGMCLECYWQNWIDFDHSHKTRDDGITYIAINFWQEPIVNFEEYS